MILVFVHTITNRITYLFNWLFAGQPGIDFTCTTDPIEFMAFKGAKFQYGGIPMDNDYLYWPSYGLLEETGIREQKIDIGSGHVLFPVAAGNADSHDPFSACSYLLSRYEEYLPFQPDRYGQFEPRYSVLAKKGMMEYPLADALRQQIIQQLLSFYPGLRYKPVPFSSTISFDIDQAFEFAGKSVIRTVGSAVKSFFVNRKRLSRHLRVLRGVEPDPYDTYDFILNELKRSGLAFQFFVLCRSGTLHDRQVSIHHRKFKGLIRTLTQFTSPGIHPSYYSDRGIHQLQNEINFLQSVTGRPIVRSRQHYLRLFIPFTYRKLLALGIQEDYSMGYASRSGFRAGTCSPYFWYDLSIEAPTPLKIFPVTFMEGTFAEDLRLPPETAWEQMQVLMNTVEQFSGHFIPIWHNHTVSSTDDWNLWRNTFIKMINWLEERTT